MRAIFSPGAPRGFTHVLDVNTGDAVWGYPEADAVAIDLQAVLGPWLLVEAHATRGGEGEAGLEDNLLRRGALVEEPQDDARAGLVRLEG